MSEEKIGEVVGYFSKIGVAAIKVTNGNLHTGDTIHIKGHTTDFQQKVGSMQLEHKEVEVAKPGDDVGIKVNEKTRDHDTVYKIPASD